MTNGEISRRGVLVGGVGLGLAAVAAGTGLPDRAEARPGPGQAEEQPVSMAMHVHSCFSEGGSYASGGGGASMMAQLDQARQNGIDAAGQRSGAGDGLVDRCEPARPYLAAEASRSEVLLTGRDPPRTRIPSVTVPEAVIARDRLWHIEMARCGTSGSR